MGGWNQEAIDNRRALASPLTPTTDLWEYRRKVIELVGTLGGLFGVVIAVYPLVELFPDFPVKPWIALYFVMFIVLTLHTYSGALTENESVYSTDASLLSVVFSFSLSIYLSEIMLQPLSNRLSPILPAIFVIVSLLITVALYSQFRISLRVAS